MGRAKVQSQFKTKIRMQRRITDFITYVAGLRGQDDDEQGHVSGDEDEVDRATDG